MRMTKVVYGIKMCQLFRWVHEDVTDTVLRRATRQFAIPKLRFLLVATDGSPRSVLDNFSTYLKVQKLDGVI